MNDTEEFFIRACVSFDLFPPPPHQDRDDGLPINLFILESFTCAVNHDCRRPTDIRFVFERS